MKLKFKQLSVILAVTIASCTNQQKNITNTDSMTVSIPDTVNFNQIIDGKQVGLYILKNEKMQVAITNYGGRIVSILVPDKSGQLTDVNLGYDSIKAYQKEGEPFFGTLVGRYGNRIAKGKFFIDNKEYNLELNNGPSALHGGTKGFHAQVWDVTQPNDSTLLLSYNSPDGDGGYPGNVKVKVTYTLTANSSIKMDYEAQTDKKTVLNLTNHAYFNLNGEGNESILNHMLMIDADAITPVDSTLIPTGKLMLVAGTPFDFRKANAIGERINKEDEQLKNGLGYDHNFVLNKKAGLQKVATVYSPDTKIKLSILTEEPGLQFYSGNFLTGKDKDGKGGKSYAHRSGFCLETQHFPDSPNQPSFPSTILNPGETYKTTTVYQFSIHQ
jgi:aldose 1-epimerase